MGMTPMDHPASAARKARIKAFVERYPDRQPVLVNMCLRVYPAGELRLRARSATDVWAGTVRIPSGCLRKSLDSWLETPAIQTLLKRVEKGFRPPPPGRPGPLGLTADGLQARSALETEAEGLPRVRMFHATSWFRGIPLDFAWRPGESLDTAVERAHRHALRLETYLVGSVKEALLLRAEQVGDLRVDTLLYPGD